MRVLYYAHSLRDTQRNRKVERWRTMTKFKKISALALIVFTVVILLSVGLTACNWQQVTIVLDCDGGFLGEDASVSLDVKTGEKTDLGAYVPEKDGYVFEIKKILLDTTDAVIDGSDKNINIKETVRGVTQNALDVPSDMVEVI